MRAPFVACLFVLACKPTRTEDPDDLRRQAERATGRVDVVAENGEIIATFEKYRDALVDLDGDAAVEQVSEGTIVLYESYVDMARKLNRAGLEALAPLDLVTVLRIRIEFRKERLAELDGRELLAETIARGWTGQVADVRLSAITIEGELAHASIASRGETPDFFFVREKSKWKLDLVALIELSRPLYENMYEKEGGGRSRLDFCRELASSLSGIAADASIYDPP